MIMLTISEYADNTSQAQDSLTLPFELRQKARLKTQLDSGETIGITLPRGKILRGGDKLRTNTGLVVEVKAAVETVSTVNTNDSWLFARICYHLGNRHVPLQIGLDNGISFCRYLHDHVLDEMVKGLGLTPTCEKTTFEPESGAYAQGHSHTHSH